MATTENSELYERDFFEWTQVTATALRAGDLDAIARDALAEELEDMGRRDLREVRSRATVLIVHMLKWQFQPDLRSRSWLATINVQRQDLATVFEQSPSLERKLGDALTAVYRAAIGQAVIETGLPKELFPSDSPWTVEQILSPDFLPN
jgi:hypothetical protein